jgi:hypothetical protein
MAPRMQSSRGLPTKSVVPFGLALLLFAAARTAAANPAYARRYALECGVCHAPAPRLTLFGERFLNNGYRTFDPYEPADRRGGDVENDPLHVFRKGPPLALHFVGNIQWDKPAVEARGFLVPYYFKVVSGGHFSDGLSYYATFYPFERARPAHVEDAFLTWRLPVGLSVWLSAGQFRVSDPVMASDPITFRGRPIHSFTVGESRAGLDYDRGFNLTVRLPSGTEAVFFLVNGVGIENAPIFDSDAYKNTAVHMAQSFGGGAITVGFLGYWGRELGAEGRCNATEYYGPDLRIRMGRWDVLLEYLRRTDSNPFFRAVSGRQATDACLAEAVFSPGGEDGRWFLALSWNRIRSSVPATDQNVLSLAVNAVLHGNIIALVEYGYDWSRSGRRFSAGLVTAF